MKLPIVQSESPSEQSAILKFIGRMSAVNVLMLEAFNGGSHAHFMGMLGKLESKEIHVHLESLPGKKFKWRMRASALFFAQQIPRDQKFDVIFCTSVCNLCELMGLRADLQTAKKILYFHENQLAGYPVQVKLERDVQLGFSQLISSQVADVILWNSSFNRDQFVNQGISELNKVIPTDQRFNIEHTKNNILLKSHIVPVPLDDSWSLQPSEIFQKQTERTGPLHILWNHRLEYDKQPNLFFEALVELKQLKLPFLVTILGDNFREDLPEYIVNAKEKLKENIIHWGFLPSSEDYKNLLLSGTIDIVVSTAIHEFQGLSILESTLAGIFPFCPNRLAYPEYLREECLYNTDKQFKHKLRYFAKNPGFLRAQTEDNIRHRIFDVSSSPSIESLRTQRFSPIQYLWSNMESLYKDILLQ